MQEVARPSASKGSLRLRGLRFLWSPKPRKHPVSQTALHYGAPCRQDHFVSSSIRTYRPAFTSGMTLATAFAAPVEDGMMLPVALIGRRNWPVQEYTDPSSVSLLSGGSASYFFSQNLETPALPGPARPPLQSCARMPRFGGSFGFSRAHCPKGSAYSTTVDLCMVVRTVFHDGTASAPSSCFN